MPFSSFWGFHGCCGGGKRVYSLYGNRDGDGDLKYVGREEGRSSALDAFGRWVSLF